MWKIPLLKKVFLVITTLVFLFMVCSCAAQPHEDTVPTEKPAEQDNQAIDETESTGPDNTSDAAAETASVDDTDDIQIPPIVLDPSLEADLSVDLEKNDTWPLIVTVPTVISQTFYGTLSENFSDLPTLPLNDALQANHIDPATVPGIFQKTILPGPYYMIDLSHVVPVCFTTDGELVCKLRDDPAPITLIVLDSAEAPTCARYYFGDSWDISQEQVAFLLDDKKPNSRELILCEKLFQIHLDHEGMEEIVTICDDPDDIFSHTISVLFDNYPGLIYRFCYSQYRGDKSYYVETRPDGKTVQVEWIGVNVGPRPSGFVEPTVNEVDSIPTN